MKIINLTQHVATIDQMVDGVFEPEDKKLVQDLITFTSIPTKEDMAKRAKNLANIALQSKADHAMVGGVAYFVPTLENELRAVGIKPIHSFTQRVSEDRVMEDGTIQKSSVFKHAGWVEL
jgi:hypothetical protein rm378p002